MARPPIRPGEVLTLTPHALGPRGLAIAEAQGWEVRVTEGIPGEAAEVRVEHVSRGAPVAFARAEAAPGPLRREIRCRIHARCGGCGLQQATVATQGRLKRGALLAALERHGVVAPEPDPLQRRGQEFGYRNRSALWVGRHRGKLRLGAPPPHGQDLVDTSGCDVLLPAVEEACARVRQDLAQADRNGGVPLAPGGRGEGLRSVLVRGTQKHGAQATLVWSGEHGVRALRPLAQQLVRHQRSGPKALRAVFVQRHDAPGNRLASTLDAVLVAGPGPVQEKLGPVRMTVPPTAFVQVNPAVCSWLYTEAAERAGAQPGERVVDLYCGSGGLSLQLAMRGVDVFGMDSSIEGIRLARRHARSHRARRARYRVGQVEQELHRLDLENTAAVLVNPPRKGLHEKLRAALLEVEGPRRLVYLSCNPDSLARDLAALSSGWEVERLTPVDMMPQTAQLEVLATLTRR